MAQAPQGNPPAPAGPQAEEGTFGANPGSIGARIDRDREPREHLFQFPGVDRLVWPWAELRNRLAEHYGFKPALSFTHLFAGTPAGTARRTL